MTEIGFGGELEREVSRGFPLHLNLIQNDFFGLFLHCQKTFKIIKCLTHKSCVLSLDIFFAKELLVWIHLSVATKMLLHLYARLRNRKLRRHTGHYTYCHGRCTQV